MNWRLMRRIIGGTIGIVGVLSVLLGVWFWRVLAGSVAGLEGGITLSALQAPVEIKRDRYGVPTVIARNRLDLARALGFLHGQERFFQMDMIRRSGAGEVSELTGKVALPIDLSHRLHRFRARANAILAQMPEEHRKLIEAYAEGVNAGLSALAHKPFEYSLLRAEPIPWRPADSLLAIYAMYFELQDSSGWPQRRKALAEKALGPDLANFLYPRGEPGDAALDGSLLPEPRTPERAAAPPISIPASPPPLPNGSNAFAVSGAKTSSGRAIVANDMHLPLRVPNNWYRARLLVQQSEEVALDLNGVTLPGVPLLVAGSNGKVAWGLTNSHIATGDAIRLDPVPGDPRAYLTPNGPLSLSIVTERVCPVGSPCQDLQIESSIWGPVVAHDADGTRIVWRWTADDMNAIDFRGLLGFETASTVREAFDAAHLAGLPQQNLVAVDREGHAGWTIIGQIPIRVGLDDRPNSWADGSRGWQGYLSPYEVPEVLDPADGIIWSANNRLVGGAALALLGDGGYASAARAQKIRDDLKAKGHATERDLLSIQLDVQASALEPWQKLLVKLLEARRGNLSLAMLNYVKNWGEAAATDSVGYRLVRSFEEEAVRLIYGGFGGAIRALAYPDAGPLTPRRAEWPSLRLLTERPNHLVPAPFQSWNEVMDALYDRVAERVRNEAGGDLSQFTWGRRNHSGIHHPLALGLPAIGLLTDPPEVPMPGDTLLPRVGAPGFGSTERFVVSPGHEGDGIFEMPVGEASNPLSPYFLAGHSDWLEGRASPFMPESPRWTLVLKPGKSQ
jgi:penicillin G amidase